jgi:hypothetical protein
MARELSPLAQAAKTVRAQIKVDRAAGKYEGLPAEVKISVRSETASMYSNLAIDLSGVPIQWGWEHGGKPAPALKKIAEALADLGREHAPSHSWVSVTEDDALSLASRYMEGWQPGRD